MDVAVSGSPSAREMVFEVWVKYDGSIGPEKQNVLVPHDNCWYNDWEKDIATREISNMAIGVVMM